MRILYLDHYAGSPAHGMEYRPYYLSREWVGMGHEVTIVAASFAHVRTRQPALGGEPTIHDMDGIRYLWLPTPVYEGNGMGRMLNMMAFLRRAYSVPRILAGERFDLVIASSTYPFDNYPAHAMARRWKARHVFEVHDLWPLSPLELGGYSRLHPFIVATQMAEDFSYRKADSVISLLPAAEDYMRSRGLAPGKFHHVPNGIAVEEWRGDAQALPASHAAAISRLRAEGKFLVCYAGSHGLANALDSLLDAAKLCRDTSMAFLLVGGGPEKARLEARIAAEGLHNAVSLPAVPKAAIPALLRAMDVLYIGLQRQSLFRFGISPNKLLDYMMAGRPVVQAIEAGNDMTTEAGCGISVRPEDPDAILGALDRLRGLTDAERKAIGELGTARALAEFDYRVLARKFLENVAKE